MARKNSLANAKKKHAALLEREAEVERKKEEKRQRKESELANKSDIDPDFLSKLEEHGERKRKRKMQHHLALMRKRLAKRGIRMVPLDEMDQVEEDRPRKKQRSE